MRPALNPGTGYPRGNAFAGGWMYLLDRAIRYTRYLKAELAAHATLGAPQTPRPPPPPPAASLPPIILAPCLEQHLRQDTFFRLLWAELPAPAMGPELPAPAGADPARMRDIARAAVRFIRALRADAAAHSRATADPAHRPDPAHWPDTALPTAHWPALTHGLPTAPPEVQTHAAGSARRLDAWVRAAKVRWELVREARAEAAGARVGGAREGAGEDGAVWMGARVGGAEGAGALLADDLRAVYDEYDIAPNFDGDEEDPMDEDVALGRDGDGNAPDFNDNAPYSNDNAPGLDDNDIAPDFNDNAPYFNDNAPDFNDNAPYFNDNAPYSNDSAPDFDFDDDDGEDPLGDFSEAEAARVMRFYESG
ncbi:hypothetical protein HDZ31DRAFT_78774, partial [Schizophyllum fasciatum]